MSLDDLIKKEKTKGKSFGRGGNKFGGAPKRGGSFQGGRQGGNFVPRQVQGGAIFKRNRGGNQFEDNFRRGGRFQQQQQQGVRGPRIQRVSAHIVVDFAFVRVIGNKFIILVTLTPLY